MVALAQSDFGTMLSFVLPAGLKFAGILLPVESATVTVSVSLLRRWVTSIGSPFFSGTVWV